MNHPPQTNAAREDIGLSEIVRVLKIKADALVMMAGSVGANHTAALGNQDISDTRSRQRLPRRARPRDLGMIKESDVCLVISNSGETSELADLITYARRFSIPLIGITGRAGSTLAQQSDVTLLLPDAAEACPIGVPPTTSTTATLALGDALAS